MFREIDILGVYVAPFVVMMLAAWLLAIPLRMAGDRWGVSRRVWHPGLFGLCVYVIVLSLVVLGAGDRP